MIRASFISEKGAWSAKPADTIILDYEGRHRRRIAMTGVRGIEFMLDLPDAVVLRNGDALVLDDGRLIEIVAAPEELAELRCGDPQELAELAYHLGNRHVTVEIMPNRIRIRRDAVIEDMARGVGAKVAHIEAPFEPDRGAYERAKRKDDHKQDHRGHDRHKHGHHGHEHGAHEHAAHGEAGHVHDETCGHDDHAHADKHEHDHKHGHHHDDDDHKGHKH
jgi:urease accessory protein